MQVNSRLKRRQISLHFSPRYLLENCKHRYRSRRWTSLNCFSATVILSLFGMVWLWHLSAVALTAPMDNIEQWVWSHALRWGYHKHPPLPTWLLAIPQVLTGPTAWTTQVLGALCTLSSVLIFANLLRQIWGRHLALLALLAGLCITFYNGRLNYYNHNILLLLFIALSAQCWWMILQSGQRRWWIALGLCAGLGMLSKYQFLLVVLPSAYFIWHIKPWQKPQQLQGLLWAVGTAVIVFVPHLLWLLQQDLADSPIRYALKTSLPEHLSKVSPMSNRIRSGVWLLDLLLNRCLPALLFLWLVKMLAFKKAVTFEQRPSAKHATTISGTRFLMVWGLMPPLTITALGLIWGMDLQMQWGTAFALWLIPPFMAAFKMHERPHSLLVTKVTWGIFLLIQAGLMIHSYQTSAYGCCAGKASLRWRLFDSTAVAHELQESTHQANIDRIHIISGPATAAGAIALALPDHPKILIDNNLKISPWIKGSELQAPGVIQLWAPQSGPDQQTRLPSGWGWTPY
jgi:4-amino-4-deoxy-L-arabinose transferase-like glycosyltransferase